MRDEVLIQAIDNTEDVLLHGGKWSEEAKERVRQARRAGKRVAEMFGDAIKKAYTTPISSNTNTTTEYATVPSYQVKNKNGTTTAGYGYRTTTKTSGKSLKDYIHGTTTKSKKVTKGQVRQTYDKNGNIINTKKYTNKQLIKNAAKKLAETKRTRNSR